MQNEKLSALAAAAYEAARQAGALAADAAYGIGLAAERQVSAVRRQMRAAAVERRIGGKLAEVGEMLYATHTGTPTDSDRLEEKLREVDALTAQLDALQGKPAAVCGVCGGEIRPGDRFCRNCGGKI